MARGDGLHPAASWQNCPGDLCPCGQDVAAPNDVRGCPVPGRRSVATPSLSHIEASPCGIAPLGRHVHKSRDSTLGLRDNGVAEWPGIEKLQTILEDKNEDQMLELE